MRLVAVSVTGHLAGGEMIPVAAKPSLSLKSFLTRLIWTCVLPLALLSCYLAVEHLHSMQVQREAEAANLTRNFAASLNHQIASRVAALQVLAASPLLEDPARWPQFYRQAQGFYRSFDNHLLLADASGHMLMITRVPYGAPLPKLPVVTGQSAAQTALATGKPAVGDAFLGPVAKVQQVAIAVPVPLPGRKPLLLLSVVPTSAFQERLNELVLPSGASLTVLDSKGKVIAHRSPGNLEPPAPLAPVPGHLVLKVAQAPWSVVLSMHHAVEPGTLVMVAAALLAAILAATGAGVLGGKLASRSLGRSVASLVSEAGQEGACRGIAEIEQVRTRLTEAQRARERAEATLRQGEERYGELVQNANSAIVRWRRDGIITFFNEYAQHTFGYSLEEALGRHVGMLVPDQESTGADLTGLVDDIVAHPERYESCENENLCRDGRRIWMTWTNRPIFNTSGEVEEILAIGSDVTQQKHAQCALNRSEQQLRLFFEHSPASLAMFDRDMCYLYVSNRWLLDYHLEGQELRGRSHYEVFPEIGEEWKAIHRRCLAGEVIRSDADRFLRADGSVQWLRWECRPWWDGPDQVGGMVVFSEDITARRVAEERNAQQTELLRAIALVFHQAMLARSEAELGMHCLEILQELTDSRFGFICDLRADGNLHNIALSNPGWELCRMTDEQGRRRPPGWFPVHGVYGRVVKDGAGFFCNDPAAHPDSIGLPEGHPPLTAFLGVPLQCGGENFGMIALGNRPGGYGPEQLESLEALAPVITEVVLRKRAELALVEREERLRRAEEMAHLGHWRLDLARHELSWSDELYRIVGRRREDFPAAPVLADCSHPDDLASSRAACDPGQDHLGSAYEFRVIRPGGEERHVVSQGELELNETGEPVALFGTLQDVTEYRHKERELQDKNAELERFTYMISHDLKSPLVTVKTFLGYLERDLAEQNGERVAGDLNFIRGAAERMGRLLDELLEMSRVGRQVNLPVEVPLVGVVREALDLVAGALAARGVAVDLELPALTLCGDHPRLVEIWQNLLENACKFMGDQSEPRIAVLARGEGPQTVFSVSDNGIGIEPQYQEKVFGLFEKLDRGAEGTGLGLALVRRIVELNGGKIWAESAGRGEGTSIHFTLPKAVRLERGGDIS